jgi:molybdenum cofactor cytidylyltransferase
LINSARKRIGAVVLAAGMSTRMGRPKMILPWGNRTVIGQVVHILSQAKLRPIAVVTGIDNDLIVQNLQAYDFIEAFNPDFGNGEMLVSLQVGLGKIIHDCTAVMIVLGDQPQIELTVVKIILQEYMDQDHQLIIPSYQMHRGHPWLIGEKYWPEILQLQPPRTMQDLIRNHTLDINYIDLNTTSILLDIDTLEDYETLKP